MELSLIFSIEDASQFSGKITEYLFNKSNYGETLSNLNPSELTIYLVEELQTEVMNGGFDQYFFNSSGDHWEDAVIACEKIGAVKTADLLREAVQAFGCELPKNREQREETIDSKARDGYDEALTLLDSAFYDYSENVDTLSFQYCQRHKELFFNEKQD